MRPRERPGHASLSRGGQDATARRNTRAHKESCPEGNCSDLPQRRCPARTPHTGRPRELSVVRVRKPCDPSRNHSFSLSNVALARAAVRSRNCEGRSVFAPNAGRERNAPAAFQRPTALLFSYYLRGCSRARSVRTLLIRNYNCPDALSEDRGEIVTKLTGGVSCRPTPPFSTPERPRLSHENGASRVPPRPSQSTGDAPRRSPPAIWRTRRPPHRLPPRTVTAPPTRPPRPPAPPFFVPPSCRTNASRANAARAAS